jgi:CHAT domain-containing protein
VSDESPKLVLSDPPVEVPGVRHDLTAGLPAGVALLKVIPTTHEGRPAFRLEGHFGATTWRSDEQSVEHQLNPFHHLGRTLGKTGDRAEDQALLHAAAEYYQFVMSWSNTKYELNAWLAGLRAEVGGDLRLVVWDDTDMGVPWELFRHSVDGKATWLGVEIPVIRWTTVHDARRHAQFSAERPGTSVGDAIYYESEDLAPDERLSVADLMRCHPMAGMVDLLEALTSASGRYGLVYVRAHGTHAHDAFRATLGGVPLIALDSLDLQAIRASGSVVMLNACNSARPVIDDTLGDVANRNFTEPFLRHHAAAVVATMAAVPVASSAALARAIIDAAQSGGVNLPELLRRYRAAAARNLPRNTLTLTREDQEIIRGFLFASMFVYFGHPAALITLEKA